MDIFKQSSRISIYLSMEGEVSTKEIVNEMFDQNKEVIEGHRLYACKFVLDY